MIKNAMPMRNTAMASPSNAVSLDVAGQPAELSSISGQLRHGCKNITKLPAAPARVSRSPIVRQTALLEAFILHSNTATFIFFIAPYGEPSPGTFLWCFAWGAPLLWNLSESSTTPFRSGNHQNPISGSISRAAAGGTTPGCQRCVD